MRDSINSIYEALAEKHNVPKEAIKQLEKDWWYAVRKEMASGSGRNIIIHNWGSLHLKKHKLIQALWCINRDKQLNEVKFKEGKIEQIPYLYKWMALTRIENRYSRILKNVKKREARKKGDREGYY